MSNFSLLITTDNHLGYKESDEIRGQDSFLAFGEALEIARDNDVDFVLLGGDLFHNNRPSPNVEHNCIKIIRQHMNASSVKKSATFRRISGDFSHFQKLKHANFEDPNIIAPCPILTIHGNHDDPTGPSSQTVCEKLATCGLLNYFGADQTCGDDKRVIEPIVLEKDGIKIALYGMGFVPDAKLRVALENGEIIFDQPPSDTYNILVVHQNRVPHNKNKVIEDSMFPGFFHLIIRGHEHDFQAPEALPHSKVDGLVYQPGSTVATSVSVMEQGSKKIGIFKISKNQDFVSVQGDSKQPRYTANYDLVPLRCCRSMIFKDIYQKEILKYLKKEHRLDKCTSQEYKTLSQKYVEECIEKLLQEHIYNYGTQSIGSDHFRLPLIRIRLEYVSKQQRFDEFEIRSKFYPNRVANESIVLYKKQKLSQTEGGQTNVTFIDDECDEDEEGEADYIDIDEEQKESIEKQIENYFKDKPPSERLQALSLAEYTNFVNSSMDGGSVIAKLIREKKKDILLEFNLIVCNEETARDKFHDESQVEEWFLSAFGSNLPRQEPQKASG